MRRPLQEINAGSMADIAFLLLIFFLMTSTMDYDIGISRKLPPPLPPDMPKPPEIKERNVLLVLINQYDQLFIESETSDIKNLAPAVKEFIKNSTENPNLSEKKVKEIALLGKQMVSKGVVSLRSDRNTTYEKYIEVQNEIVKAFNELRDEYAMQKFGTRFKNLDNFRQMAIQELYPLSISEAEPVDLSNQ
jgi:biopolymer transport protein ExbD